MLGHVFYLLDIYYANLKSYIGRGLVITGVKACILYTVEEGMAAPE